MELSVIIVNYNVKYFLENCLLSVSKACAAMQTEIFVVDNNSSDGSREYLGSRFPAVNFIWLDKNIGFAKANNIAVSRAKGDCILFLNPDTIVPEDCFLHCCNFLKTHPDCGALGVRMIDGSGDFLRESKRNLPSPAAAFFKVFGKGGTGAYRYYADQLPEKADGETAILAGAFMMLSRAAVNATQGFDEDFFMYGEDIDLGARVLQAGMRNYYTGQMTIIHFKGESTKKTGKAHDKNFYGAMKLFVKKQYKKQPAMRILMTAGIGLAKVIRAAKTPAWKKTNGESAPVNVVIYGSAEEKGAATDILVNDRRYSLSADQASPAPGDAVVFCEGENTNKNIIDLLQQKPSGISALFFARGALAIIGSDDRNSSGTVISNHG